jgi:glycosyltransferase involved in cell wall biosynthesis
VVALTLTVIIPARNAEDVLPRCLAGIAASVGAPDPDVIVVDDGSADGTSCVAEAAGARVIRLDGRGPAAARNAGAREASSDILVFFDADCVPAPGCIAALLVALADPTVVAARGGYASAQRALAARFTQLEMEEKQERLAASATTAVIDTACAAYRRAAFFHYGGFDEQLPATSAEDVDLSFRMAAGGERLVYAPGARVWHRHPERLGVYLWRKLRFGYFRARLYGRYPGRIANDGYTPRLMPAQIALAGLLGASIVASPWVSPLPTVGLAAAFLALCAPLVARAWRSDRALVPWVPAFLLARSLAQGAGLVAGFAAPPTRRVASADAATVDHRPT